MNIDKNLIVVSCQYKFKYFHIISLSQMSEATKLHSDGIINEDELNKIQYYESQKLFSIHWELRTILYLGILLLSSGIGILVYLHIDTIGHQAILAAIALASGGCFYYAFKHRQAYSNVQVKNESPLFDYIALLACLLFGTFIGYIQYQYHLFGYHYGLATAIPAVLFFYCAYIFDHKGLLALGLTGLASSAGLSIAPMQLLESNNFMSNNILFTALAFGVITVAFAKYSDVKNIKAHFSFSYHNFAANLLFIATLALLFNQPLKPLSFILLCVLSFYFIKYAIAQQSFWFLLLSTLYSYIGLSYVVFSLMYYGHSGGDGIFTLGIFYLFASCAGVIYFFINYKKILGLKK